MPAENALTFDTWSVISLWTAIAVYALAFICYSMDLAKRSDSSIKQRDRELVVAGGGSAPVPAPASDEPVAHTNNVMARIGTTLTWIAFLLHVAADVLRGIGAGRVPWSNMYEFAMTSTMLFTGVYLFVLFWKDLRYVGAFMTGLVSVLLGAASMPNIYVEITPLADPLKSTWLIIHVFVASLATAFLALAFALSVLQLLQGRRERLVREDPSRREPRVARVPGHDHRLHPVDLHAHRGRDLGAGRMGPVLGLRHQGGLDLHRVGALRRIHPRPRDPRLARHPLGMARDHRLRGGPVQLHDRQHVLRWPALIRGPSRLTPPANEQAFAERIGNNVGTRIKLVRS
jgi:hypothetical protein